MLSATRSTAMRRERLAAEHVPYTAHVSAEVVKTSSGDYIQAFRLGGASFESADDEQLNGWHERLNVLWRNLASPQVALWTHLIRRPERAAPTTAEGPGFAHLLKARYRERLAGETLMANDLYIALCYRPTSGLASGAISRLLMRSRLAPADGELADALDSCAKLAQVLHASLARYEPEPLRIYCWNDTCCSALLEYLALLINGEWRRVPLPRSPLRHVLVTTRLLFGTEAIEYRMPTTSRVGAMLAIKEYPTPSAVGMFNRLLSAPFPLVLTQSFTFLSRAAGQALLQRQYVRMVNAGDFAREISDRYKVAVDLAVHEPPAGGDPRNFHAHLLTTTREVTPTGLGAKTGIDMELRERRRRGLPDHRQEYISLRERWATLTNDALREAHIDARIDHRSLAAQGIDREPRPSIPLMHLKMEQRGLHSQVAERLRAKYRDTVAHRLERQAGREGQDDALRERQSARSAAVATVARTDVEEIRRRAREAWLQLRTQESQTSAQSSDRDQGSEREAREHDAAAAKSSQDDFAL
jgi:hypothetical protein